jgi:hypothetical protein
MRPDKDLGFSPWVFSLPGKCSGMSTSITGAIECCTINVLLTGEPPTLAEGELRGK